MNVDIFQFNVSVDDRFRMHIAETRENLAENSRLVVNLRQSANIHQTTQIL